jgi:type VI secretion system protein ImpL
MRRVANIAARQPAPLKYWLQSVSRFDFLQAAALADTRSMQAINAAWQSSVLPVCAATLDDRYPVAASSSQDVTLADFSTLFAPGGLLDEFWQQHLEPYVDTGGTPWRLKRQTGLPLADSSLAFFERVAVIRSAMFSGRERTPRLNMQVKPVSLSADTTMVRLVNGSQDLVYRHGPQMVTNFSWPPAGENQAQIDFSRLSDPDRASSIVKRGPWALFRLFDRANTEVSESRHGMRVTFAHEGSEASFLVGAGTKAAFPTGLLEGLQCPESL